MFGKNSKPNTRIDTLIGAGTTIDGNITFTGGLRIDGELRGNVTARSGDQPGTLVISEQARVEGEVSAPHVVINGAVTGPVHSADFLELQPAARITGDIEYNSIEIHLGAIVQGRLLHLGTSVPVVKAVDLKLANAD
jgi:cytoskeletal protein CcmA (bactofilin family)